MNAYSGRSPADEASLPISLIIPVFGRYDLLGRTIRSAVNQTRPPREIIIVHDGSFSELNIGDIAAPRIVTLRHDDNRGAAAARNTGLRCASEEWITFLDSDDYLFADSLERRWAALPQAERSGQAPDNFIYGCGWSETDDHGRVLATRVPREGRTVSDMVSGCWYMPGTCLLMRLAALLQGGFWQDESFMRFEDFDWSIQLALAGFSLKILPVVGAAISRRRVQDPDAVERAAERLVAKWRSAGLDGGLLARIEAYMALECAAANYYRGRIGRATTFLARSFLAVPRLSVHLSPGWERLDDAVT